MFSSSNRVAIVSSAQTQLRDAWSDRQHVDLISQAVAAALKGTGLAMSDVDFVIDSGSDILDGRSISNCGFMGAMGAHQKEESRVEEDGLWAALYAATKIAAGPSTVGLVIAHSKPSEGSVPAFWASQTEPFCQRPVGFGQLPALGLQAQAYLAQADADESDFARIVAHDWASAARNPAVDTPYVPDEAAAAAAAMKALPLREHDVSRHVDGAVALVVASKEVAERVSPQPVWITGIGTAMDQHAFAMREPGELEAATAAAQAAYRNAGIDDPTTLSLAETSATSVAAQLMLLESLGLAEKGKGSRLYRDGSATALNPSGGSLPADPIMATGAIRLHEAARQLTGRADHAPAGATSAVVHGTGGVGQQNHCVMTLEV